MAERKPEWLKAGDPVITTTETVTDCGAFSYKILQIKVTTASIKGSSGLF
jgi:hypothetical protein